MESWDRDCRSIEGCVVLIHSGAGVGGGCFVVHLYIKKGVNGDHFPAHDISPFDNLGSDVNEKGVRRPPAKYHDFGG
jgi:hypothetical protein